MSRKRQRAILTQDESSLAREADEADADLVGYTNALIGGDRSTAGVRIKQSKFPSKPGIYKGGFNIKDRVLSRVADSIATPVDFQCVQNDFNAKSGSGGWQLIFDPKCWLSRSTTTGEDSLTLTSSHGMNTTEYSTFKKVYRKLGTDVPQFTYTAVESTDENQTQMPSLYISNFKSSKTFNNVGPNTIVLELYDMMCTQDTDESPLECWFKDLLNGNYSGAFVGSSIAPSTTAAMNVSWGDPGVRPKPSRDKTLHSFWKTLAITRYLVRSGQSITHTVTLPNTEISHTKLYPYDEEGAENQAISFSKDLSICTMGFGIGEMCFDEDSGSQQMSTSSVFLQGRATMEFTARTLPRVKQRYCCLTNFALESATNRLTYFPALATDKQAILSQQTPGTVIKVEDFDIKNLA